MKYYSLITVLILFSCNSNQQTIKPKEVEINSSKCFEYPSVIDSLQVKDLYDSARWYVYTWYCDNFYKPKDDSTLQKSYGELELRFYNLSVKHDTLELNFNFIDKQKIILPSMMSEYKELNTGVGFDIITKTKIYMLSPNGYSSVKKGGTNRYENPLQPEVLAYIKNNLNKLNDCFKELAERKGIIK